MPPQVESSASHRTNILRKWIQDPLRNRTANIIGSFYMHDLLNNTQIEHAISLYGMFFPDDVTLSSLEITVKSSKDIITNGANTHTLAEALLGWLLDGGDGNVARSLNMASPEGATKDALTDRMSELKIARLIDDARNQYNAPPAHIAKDLSVAFQLSTLTKTMCEMSGVHTREGGIGSMIERRRILIDTLITLHRVSRCNDNKNRIRLLRHVDNNNSKLIDSSWKRAAARAKTIAKAQKTDKFYWENPNMGVPGSTAASEALKYAALVTINKRLGFDMVGHLNTLSPGLEFPTAEYLINRYPHIAEGIQKTNDFLNQALSIAGFSK